jgi:hypothetical protein
MGSILWCTWEFIFQQFQSCKHSPRKKRKVIYVRLFGTNSLKEGAIWHVNPLHRWRIVGTRFHSNDYAGRSQRVSGKCRQTFPAQRIGGGCSRDTISSHSNGGVVFMTTVRWAVRLGVLCSVRQAHIKQSASLKEQYTRVEAGSNTSTVALRVVEDDEKGSLKYETKIGREYHGTREWLRWRGTAAIVNDRPVLSSERERPISTNPQLRVIKSGRKPQMGGRLTVGRNIRLILRLGNSRRAKEE